MHMIDCPLKTKITIDAVIDILFVIYHNSRNYTNRNYCFGFCFNFENGTRN